MGENVVKVEQICTAILLREMLMDEKKLCQKLPFYYLHLPLNDFEEVLH